MHPSPDPDLRAASMEHSRAPPSLKAKTADDGLGLDHRSEPRRPG